MGDRFPGFHLDFIGFIASFLCAIHCAAIPVVLSISALGGLNWISDPKVESIFLVASFSIAALTLYYGYRKQTLDKVAVLLFGFGFFLLLSSRLLPHAHGPELIAAILGGLLIASAHIYHWLSLRKKSFNPAVTKGY